MKCADCGVENIPGDDECSGCGHALPAENAPRAPLGDIAARVRGGTIADLKPRPAVTVAADMTVADAVLLMREERVGCVLVGKGRHISGILTERDILYKVAGVSDPAKTAVADVMHPDPECLKCDEPVSHAFHHMSVGGYRHMPVFLEDGAVGMLSSRDLLAYLSHSE